MYYARKWIVISVGLLGALVLGVFMADRAHRHEMRLRTTQKFRRISLGIRNYAYVSLSRDSEVLEASGVLQALAGEYVGPGQGRLPCPVQHMSARQEEDLPETNDGRDMSHACSWRYKVLPYVVGVGSSVDTSKPWNTPANQQGLKRYRFYSYGKPVDSHSDSEALAKEPIPDTNVMAIVGPGTAFGDGNEPPMKLKELPPQTILIAEVRSSGIPWPVPGDLDIRTMPETIDGADGQGISGAHDGFHVIFADRQVWFLSNSVPFNLLSRFFTVAEARKHDREKLLAPYVRERGPEPRSFDGYTSFGNSGVTGPQDGDSARGSSDGE